MLLNISKIGKILNQTNRLASIEFNATLPIKIEVLKEINPITYKILLGNKETETKTHIPLEVGKKYLAIVKEAKNFIKISNLKRYPKLLELLEKLPLEKELHLDKNKLIHKLTTASSKEEFLFFYNVFLAMQKNIKHIYINEKNNKAIMQYKVEKNKVKFYACYKFLGELRGFISPNLIEIYTNYENVANLILLNKDELDIPIKVCIEKEIKELFEFKNKLLDLKA